MTEAEKRLPKIMKQVVMPELALLVLTVMDKDVDSDDFVAHAVIPIPTLRQGYRSVRVYSKSGTTHGDFEHASLLCHFSMKPKV